MMQCATAHTCLMCMSLPSCSACQDNERWCTAASILTVQYRTHWFVTFIYLFIYLHMHVTKVLCHHQYSSMHDAMQLPSAIQGNNTPNAISYMPSSISCTMFIITPPAELQSQSHRYTAAGWSFLPGPYMHNPRSTVCSYNNLKKIKTVLSHNHFNATHTINFGLCIGISLGNSSTLSPTNADCAHIKKVWGRQTKQGNAPYIMQATVRSSAGSGWISLILLLDSQLW